jgi:4-amino-4-deoxy-L-arabinose transferase-like glycosyltransferase
MDIVGLRIFLFTILPLLVAGVQISLDKNTRSRERKIEVFLLYLFSLGVAGSGIGGFFAHFFLSDLVAESIGWPAGNPFQLEVAFANLALGILGIVAIGRRDGFREATVIAVTVLGVGATVVHLMDIVETGNLAPGNTLQNVGNLLKPALLIGFLAASRRAERAPDSEAHTASFELWRGPRAQAAGFMTGVVATGFGVGFAVNHPFLGSVLGVLLGAALVALIISRAPSDTGRSTT